LALPEFSPDDTEAAGNHASWLSAWQAAAAPRLGEALAPAATAAAACRRLEALGAQATPEWAAAAAPAVLGQEGPEAAVALAQLLGWAAASGGGNAALAAALGQALPLLDAAALLRALAAVRELPSVQRGAVEDGLWRWLQSDAAAAAGLAAGMCSELLGWLPYPPPDATTEGDKSRSLDVSRTSSPLLRVLRLQSSIGIAEGAAAALDEATRLLAAAAEREPDAALAWLPEALGPISGRRSTLGSGAGACADAGLAEAAVARLQAVVESLAEQDPARTLVAAAPGAAAAAAVSPALGPEAAAAASRFVAWAAAGARRVAAVVEDAEGPLPARVIPGGPVSGGGGGGCGGGGCGSAAEAWAAAAAEAASVWLRALASWAEARTAALSPQQALAVMTAAAPLADLVPGSASASGASNNSPHASGWLVAAESALRAAAAGALSPSQSAGALAAAAALPRAFGCAPSGPLLEAALSVAARDHLSASAGALCDALTLLEAAAAATPGTAGLPARHVPAANGICAALASKGHGTATEPGLGARRLARATAALAGLTTAGGGAGLTAKTAALSAALGHLSGGAGGAAGDLGDDSGRAWAPPAHAARWLVASWAAAAQDAPASVLLGFTPSEAAELLIALTDCAALAGLCPPAGGEPPPGAAGGAGEDLRQLQPLLAAAGAKLAASPRSDVAAATAAGGTLALAVLARAACGGGGGIGGGRGDAALSELSEACLAELFERASKWPPQAQRLVERPLSEPTVSSPSSSSSSSSGSGSGGGGGGGGGSSSAGASSSSRGASSSGGSTSGASASGPAAPPSQSASDGSRRGGGGSGQSEPSAPALSPEDAQALIERALAAAPGRPSAPPSPNAACAHPTAPELLAALGAVPAAGDMRLTKREAQRLLGEVEAALQAVAVGGGAAHAWPSDSALQYVLVSALRATGAGNLLAQCRQSSPLFVGWEV
jgi:hypothetical protein